MPRQGRSTTKRENNQVGLKIYFRIKFLLLNIRSKYSNTFLFTFQSIIVKSLDHSRKRLVGEVARRVILTQSVNPTSVLDT